jgi:hypothetical protein
MLPLSAGAASGGILPSIQDLLQNNHAVQIKMQKFFESRDVDLQYKIKL